MFYTINIKHANKNQILIEIKIGRATVERDFSSNYLPVLKDWPEELPLLDVEFLHI